MATRNFETREGFDFWDRLCKIPRYAFLLSKAGNSVQKAEGLGNWIDRDEAMAVVGDAQEEINVLRQDCANMIAELDDLRAQPPSQGGEAVEWVGWTTAEPDGDGGYQLDIALGPDQPDFGVHPLMTVAQHQRILAASVGSADPVGVVFAMEALAPGGGVKSHASLNRDLPAGTKLYTHPADQVAEGVTRELLERATNFGRPDLMEIALGELRALLAKP